jgi:hypothetical protein
MKVREFLPVLILKDKDARAAIIVKAISEARKGYNPPKWFNKATMKDVPVIRIVFNLDGLRLEDQVKSTVDYERMSHEVFYNVPTISMNQKHILLQSLQLTEEFIIYAIVVNGAAVAKRWLISAS